VGLRVEMKDMTPRMVSGKSNRFGTVIECVEVASN
jgi:hypothetical protein